MSFPKEYESAPRTYGDTRWNQEDQCEEYVHSDMQLRITAKSLMVQQAEELVPRKREEVERELGHVVFELAYRTQRIQEYIEMQRQAVILEQPDIAS
jgi:hypothetical protein